MEMKANRPGVVVRHNFIRPTRCDHHQVMSDNYFCVMPGGIHGPIG
jgi:hypothetical protein